MIKIILFFIFYALQCLAEDHFSSSVEQQKVLGCLERYNNFMTNHRLFKKIDFNRVCSCEQVSYADLQRHSFELLAGLRMHVVTLNMGEATHCQKDFKSCFILTFKNLFDSARSADDVCRTIDGLIAEEFKTPFSNDNLKNALMSFIPIFQAREMDWGRLFCDKFLPMAKLHNKCSQGGSSGAGGGIEGRINGPSVKEEIPIEESLH